MPQGLSPCPVYLNQVLIVWIGSVPSPAVDESDMGDRDPQLPYDGLAPLK